jgi:hypothetical protein
MDDIKDEDLAPEGQQHTGNHPAPDAADAHGADRFGGTRAGAANVEKPVTNIEKGTDVDKVAGVERQLDDTRNADGPTLRVAERDERGRM